MCFGNNGCFGGCQWILLVIILLCCCGCGANGWNSCCNNGCGDCGCNNCGCNNCGCGCDND